MPSPGTDRPAIISTAGARRGGGFRVARERIACFDAFRIPHDFKTGQQLDITRRAASDLQADALALYLGREFGPILLQRILRRFLVRETGFLVAPENDCAPPGRLAARPDLERGRAAGASPRVLSSRRCALIWWLLVRDITRVLLLPSDIGGEISQGWLPMSDRRRQYAGRP